MILIYKAVNKCLRIKQACVRSAILAVRHDTDNARGAFNK